jgi:hypothetical protein
MCSGSVTGCVGLSHLQRRTLNKRRACNRLQIRCSSYNAVSYSSYCTSSWGKQRCSSTAMQVTRGRGYSSYSLLTSVLDGGVLSASRLSYPLPPGKDPWYLLDRKLGGRQGWCRQRLEKKSSASAGDRTPVVQSVITHTLY